MKRGEFSKNALNVLKIETQFHIIYIVGIGVSNMFKQGTQLKKC